MPLRMMAWLGVGCGCFFALAAGARAELPPTPVGVAVVDITPTYPIRMSGYESRKTESTGVESRLKAKALAIGEGQGLSVLLAVDNCAVPGKLADEVAAKLEKSFGLPRDRFVVCSSHTHAAPSLANGIPFIFGGAVPTDQLERIERYTREVTVALEEVAVAAIKNRKPARLDWGQGKAGFAVNRRVLKDGRWVNFGITPDGAVDRSLPILRISDLDGKLRSVLVGYACHCTTLEGNFDKLCADWAGYACEELEQSHPGALALVVIGCGADANPQPRGKLQDAKTHGTEIAREVERLLKETLTPVPGTIDAKYRRIELPLGKPRSRDELGEMTKIPGAQGYFAKVMLERLDRGEPTPKMVNYPVQTWSFGDELAMVFLGGEVVADYSLRIKRETKPGRLWVVAYSNDVTCYIASQRMLPEGGYEVDSSMIYYDRPARLGTAAEDTILNAVHELLPDRFEASSR